MPHTDLTVKSAQLLQFSHNGDDRGQLVALESKKEIPFAIKRVYYIFDVKNDIRRGYHAHKKLEQVAVVVRGKCTFMLDDGVSRTDVVLGRPDQGLYIGPMLWHEMYDFTRDCLLMVMANDDYDESDYIRGHDEFIKLLSC